MDSVKTLTRRRVLKRAALGSAVTAAAALAGCGEPQIVTETKIQEVIKEVPVEKVVTQIVEVEKERVVEKAVEVEVERVVTQIVEKEKIVEKIVTAEAMPVKVTPVKIVLWSFDPLHVKHFTQVASFWKDKWAQYDLSFEFLTVPFDELVTKLLANMSAGAELPDLTAIEIGQWSKFMKGDIAETQLVDITPLIGDDRSKFIEGRWTPYIKDGRIYGAESVPSLSYYYHQPALFENAGVSLPIDTWEEFAEKGKAMKSAGHSMMPIDAQGAVLFWIMYLQRGGFLFDESGDFVFDEDKNRTLAVETLRFLKDNIDAEVFLSMNAGDFWGQGSYAAYQDASLAGVTMPDWYLDLFLKSGAKNMEGQWRVQAPPMWSEGGHRTGVLGGSGFVMLQNGPNYKKTPDLVWDLLRTSYLSKEGQLLRWEGIHYSPTMYDAIEDPRFTELQDPYLGGQRIGEVYLYMSQSVPVPYPSPVMNEVRTELANQLTDGYSGDKTPEQAMDDFIRNSEDIVAKAER